MKKRKLMNALMVLVILLIAACGVMAVKSIKGPSKDGAQQNAQKTEAKSDAVQSESGTTQAEDNDILKPLVICNKTGIVTVERKSIAYEVDEQTEVRSGDIFYTRVGASVAIADGAANRLHLGEETKLKVISAEDTVMSLESGDVLVDARDWERTLALHTGDAVLESEQAVCVVTAQPAAYTVYVCAGEVTVSGEKIDETTASSGQALSILKKSDNSLETSVSPFNANAFNDAQIASLLTLEIDDTFAVTAQQLKNVTAQREQEKLNAQKELLAQEQQAKAELAQEQADYAKAEADYQAALAAGANITTDEDGNLVAETKAQYCTIEIRCDTILDNMDDLKDGKEGYVPGSGKILSKTKVAFEDGDTVFDVLKEVCSLADIQLEYSWTPLYDSYYIEGINHIYEFDCGGQSGWMYKVNGWFPNYGCSSYDLEDGDVIVWCYTCKGLGDDVGGSNF